MSENQNTEYEQAQQAEMLRQAIAEYANGAVKCGGVDRDWVNAALIRMGAEPVTGTVQYRLMFPITAMLGKTIAAKTRAEALAAFDKYVQYTLKHAQIDGSHGIRAFQVAASDGETGGKAVFYSGPMDVEVPDELPVLTLDELKNAIRVFLKDGVAEHGWGYPYAVDALANLGLDPLPPLVNKTVEVPVTGMTTLNVTVFEGDDDDAVQRATTAKLTGAKSLNVKPEEMGEAVWARSTGEAMGLHLVDDKSTDEDEKPY